MPNALFVILLGFFYNITITANSMLLTIVVSPIFTALSGSFGMAMAFRIFFLVMIIGVISVISEKETGRKPQAA